MMQDCPDKPGRWTSLDELGQAGRARTSQDEKEEWEEEREENFYTSFLVGLVRGLSDDARLKGPTRGGGGLGDHPPGVPRG